MTRNASPSGILIVDKPAGITSHDVVDRIRRIFRTKRVGHTGTLDPDATGVLVLCLGNATRLAEYLSAASKHYVAEFVFGIRTDTMDASGTVVAEQDSSHLTEEAVLALLPAFQGKILQIPPMVSARHHEGRRLYELAREGVTVERQPRAVEVSSLVMTEFHAGILPRATLEITCSTGTYIRVLAEDIGAAAGTGAHMKSLRRTWVGADADTAFTLAEAHSLADLENLRASENLAEPLLSIAQGLRAMPHFRLQAEGHRRLMHGQAVSASEICCGGDPAAIGDGLGAILDERAEVCAVVRCDAEMLLPVKVLAPL